MTEAGDDADQVPSADHRLAQVRREGELVDPVGQLERRRDEVDEVGRHHDERGDLGRQRRPPQAADRDADARRWRRRTGRARRTRGSQSPAATPPDAAPSPMPTANRTVITTIARSAADAAGDHPAGARHGRRQDHLQAAVGLVRRPLGHERGAREPGRDEQHLHVQLEEAAGRRRGRSPGKIVAKVRQQVRAAPSWSAIDPTSEASSAPMRPRPIPQAEGPRQLVAERPAERAADAEDRRREARAARAPP